MTTRCQACDASLATCSNRELCRCNRTVQNELGSAVCEWCSLSIIVPDLSDERNLAHWTVLEAAKRRLLHQLEQLDLPPFSIVTPTNLLSFQFLSDFTDAEGSFKQVYTGHRNGVITINVREADNVYREKTRVELGEPQRTLIGHLRHEYGHYLDLCIPASVRGKYVELFGDPMESSYDVAKSRYYENGVPADWKSNFVSGYATMHPWEDFAETTNLYLDMQAITSTARDSGWLWKSDAPPTLQIDDLVRESLKIAVMVSELNGDLGLPTLLPENIEVPVLAKLDFIHGFRKFLFRRSIAAARESHGKFGVFTIVDRIVCFSVSAFVAGGLVL